MDFDKQTLALQNSDNVMASSEKKVWNKPCLQSLASASTLLEPIGTATDGGDFEVQS
jgi:hypothetical protein